MQTLIRNHQRQDHWQNITTLINTCAIFDRHYDETSATEIALICNTPHFDQGQNARQWYDQGKLIGFSLLDIAPTNTSVDAYLHIYLHPRKRQQGFEQRMLLWGEQRLRQVGQAYNLPIKLRVYSRADYLYLARLLKQHNFSIERQFFTMGRSLQQPIPTPYLPDNFYLATMADRCDRQAKLNDWVKMYNESFVDHWNHHDLTTETLQTWLNSPQYRPDLNLIAISPEKQFAAFCNTRIRQLSHQSSLNGDMTIGWIDWLGTSRSFRKRGLGKSMLLSGLQLLKQQGAKIAKLSVDADNASGAVGLYRSLGFQNLNTWFSWLKV